jgi:DNA repair exonuclease SbcCD nuclease subunit
LLQATDWEQADADVRLLCVHQCVEGATVGPANYTFTTAPDVIRGADIPHGFMAVLAGHIHRHQVLQRDLRGQALAAPVLYPGSIERTTFAEAGEDKGYLMVRVRRGGAPADWRFCALPARPLVRHTLRTIGVGAADLEVRLRALIDAAPADAVLSIRVEGAIADDAQRLLSAAHLRTLAPPTMNVELRPSAGWGYGSPNERAY